MAVLNLNSPVKTSVSVSWELLKQNLLLALVSIAVVFVLNLLGVIPLLGMIFMVLANVVILNIQIYTAQESVKYDSAEQMIERFKSADYKAVLWDNFAIAFGGWLGMLVIGFTIMALLLVLMWVTGSFALFVELMQEAQEVQVESVLGELMTMVLLMVLVGAVLSYVYPLVYGRMLHAHDFGSAFGAMMTFFYPETWKRTFTSDYFKLMVGFSVVIFAAGLVLVLCFATFILIPVALAVMYWMYLFLSVAFTHAVAIADMAHDAPDAETPAGE